MSEPQKLEPALHAALMIATAVADVIQAAGQIPEGELYAMVMGKLSLENFTKVIDSLKGADLIRVDSHLIRWIGPTIARSN